MIDVLYTSALMDGVIMGSIVITYTAFYMVHITTGDITIISKMEYTVRPQNQAHDSGHEGAAVFLPGLAIIW